ncbi:glycosyl hydrolase [Hyphomicrobium methylovorum]|uniref:sialidase family protein n=1 Tax=Hyphomicrobium methylovorum TaxID=84 RepID=UPI0015E70BB4|nr:sialidase family protein [Hyphomicrobium methylovorum]MBA2125038.1 glycosyl hydrolase [Hyphomicrobium methylovorum]
MRKYLLAGASAALLALITAPPAAQAHNGHHHGPATACKTTELACASVVSTTFGSDGKLWLVWAAGGRISVASSTDLGQHISTPVMLPKTESGLDDGPDARAKIAVGSAGEVIVTFATRDEKYNGHAFITRSNDGGKTFATPEPITSNSPSQRFETAVITPDGRAFVAWIDKRNMAAAKKAGIPYEGAALAYAWSDKTGGKLETATIARDNTCECCRISVAFDAASEPVVMFRNIFDGGIRDHAVIAFSNAGKPGELHRVSDDDAKIDACPHQGPTLAIGPQDVYHATWFALGRKLKGNYYARSEDNGKTFSTPVHLGRTGTQTSRPYVLATANKVYLVYKSFDGEKTDIELMTSADAGKTWDAPRVAASTGDESDHPLLVADKTGNAYLSWMTVKDGYRLIPLEPQS